VREVEKVPYWNPHLPGFDRISNEKAFIAGWTQLPLVETARDSWRWYRNSVSAQLQYPHKQYASEWGLSLEREEKIIADWRAHLSGHLERRPPN